MENDRRRFLIGGAAGLTTILVPNVSLACFCRRRRRVCASGCKGYEFLKNCPVFNPSPSVPNSVTANTPEYFTVYGTDVYGWAQEGGVFYPAVVDDYGAATWGPCTVSNVGPDNSLTFYASETGSTPGTHSTITITVTLPAFNNCNQATWTWPPQAVTYS